MATRIQMDTAVGEAWFVCNAHCRNAPFRNLTVEISTLNIRRKQLQQ
ncbi:hypothetical protein EVA_12209 [gut metagenome]|uniref:Uncharacterized protein n=1 Tax=gut metagenome TaxID=749906 RepID=J9GJC9_9ZZZZ